MHKERLFSSASKLETVKTNKENVERSGGKILNSKMYSSNNDCKMELIINRKE